MKGFEDIQGGGLFVQILEIVGFGVCGWKECLKGLSTGEEKVEA